MLAFPNHEEFVADVRMQIPAEADRLGQSPTPGLRDKERARWTQAVKHVFNAKAAELLKGTVDFYGTTQGEEKACHEWLLDVVLYVENRGVLLAVESGWDVNIAGVVYDFWKLLSIKAPLKILLEDLGPNRRAKLIEGINEYARTFEQHLPGDIYYLINYHAGERDVYRCEIQRTCSDGRAPEFAFHRLPKLSDPEHAQAA